MDGTGWRVEIAWRRRRVQKSLSLRWGPNCGYLIKFWFNSAPSLHLLLRLLSCILVIFCCALWNNGPICMLLLFISIYCRCRLLTILNPFKGFPTNTNWLSRTRTSIRAVLSPVPSCWHWLLNSRFSSATNRRLYLSKFSSNSFFSAKNWFLSRSWFFLY